MIQMQFNKIRCAGRITASQWQDKIQIPHSHPAAAKPRSCQRSGSCYFFSEK
jgi:hypothetical protein